jgi:hypothetical protein
MMLKESLKNLSLLEDLLRQFNRKKGNHTGRQPRQAHHQGLLTGLPPGAGDEHFQNKYERIVSKDALT